MPHLLQVVSALVSQDGGQGRIIPQMKLECSGAETPQTLPSLRASVLALQAFPGPTDTVESSGQLGRLPPPLGCSSPWSLAGASTELPPVQAFQPQGTDCTPSPAATTVSPSKANPNITQRVQLYPTNAACPRRLGGHGCAASGGGGEQGRGGAGRRAPKGSQWRHSSLLAKLSNEGEKESRLARLGSLKHQQ